MPSSPTDRLRESKWAIVERLRSWGIRHPRAAQLLAPVVRFLTSLYARFELPRSVGLLEAAVGAFPDAWPRDGILETRGLWHGYRLRLDCSDYFQRLTLLLRRYPDVPTQVLIWRASRPGDTVIDAGANIGMVTLLAAWRVGPRGRVYAMEPNPPAFERLRWHMEINALTQVTPLPLGLSDREATLEFSLPGGHNLGAGTFAPMPGRYERRGASTLHARVVRADDLPDLVIAGSLIVKLDIEGFELNALRGMTGLIARHRPLILTEVNPEMLAQVGATPADLAAFLTALGYVPFEYSTRRAVLRQRRLILRRADPTGPATDIAWLHPQSIFAKRLAPWIPSAP